MGVAIKAKVTGAASGGLKLQCIAIATFYVVVFIDRLTGMLEGFNKRC